MLGSLDSLSRFVEGLQLVDNELEKLLKMLSSAFFGPGKEPNDMDPIAAPV
jgi:hypothetical protein